jgi:exodeoxyribonuclease VII large subunit
MKKIMNEKKHIVRQSTYTLSALNPTAILKRGYSITRTLDEKMVIIDSSTVHKGQDLEVILAKGKLTVKNI